MIGLALVGVVVLAIAGLWLALRNDDQQSDNAGAGGTSETVGSPKDAVPRAGENQGEVQAAKVAEPAPAADAAAQRTAGSAAVGNWVDASRSPATIKDIAVRITSIAKIPPRSGKKDEGRLLIVVEVRNTSATQKMDYIGWVDGGLARGGGLIDNFGNVYKPKSLDEVSIPGSHPPMSIYPGRTGHEVMAFEPPIAKAEFLRLELSAAAFGVDDVVRLLIPVKMIGQRLDLVEPETKKSSEAGGDEKRSPKSRPSPRPGTPEGDFGIPRGDKA